MKRSILRPFTFLLPLLLLSCYLSATPECPIITGAFSQPDGTNSDPSATGWYLDASNVASTGYFAVKSNRLHAQELGGEGVWYSRVFSTAGYSDFQVAVKITAEGDMNSSEYVKVYYKINGGAETLLDSRTGNFGTLDFTSGTLTGSNVQLIVRIYNYNNGGTQTSKYYIEQYRVFKEKGPCAVSAISVTATAANSGILTCSNPSLTLSATATGTGTTTYSWSGPNGYTSTSQNPSVGTAGTYTVVATNSTGSGSASVAVTENKTPPVIIATGGTLSCGSSVTISATSDISNATYSWTGPNGFTSTSKNPTVNTAGTYTVTATNPANGCSASQSVAVTASSVATFWLEDFSDIANGATSDAGTTAWTASPATAPTSSIYSVQNNEFKASFKGQTEGVWTSQVINIASKANVTFSVDLRSETAGSGDAFETADYVRVYYKLNGGAETLVYEDLAGIGTSTTGTASATITSAALNGSTLQIIIKTNNSDPTERYYFDNIKVSGTNAGNTSLTASVNGSVTCTATAQLQATTGSTVSAWAWTGPNSFTSTAQNPSVSAGGEYIVTATLSTGCTVSATVTVQENKTAPDITATGGILNCLSSITLNVNSSVSNASYKWTGPGSFTSTSKNPSVSALGTYTATVTNPANGCTASKSVTVTATGAAAASLWMEDFTLANGTTTDAGATSWAVQSSPSSSVFSVQSNEFRVSNIGTTGEGVWASGAINIAGKTNLVISAGVRSAVSTGGVMNTTGTYADYLRFYYKLNNGAEVLFAENLGAINNHSTTNTAISVSGISGSTLQIIVRARATGSDEFYYFDNVQVTGESLPSIDAVASAGSMLTCTSNSVALTGSSSVAGVSYNWAGPNSYSSTTQNTSVTAAGIYTLTVTDASTGCTGTDTALVSLNNTKPGAAASAGGSLTCAANTPVTLSATSSTSGVTYSWTGPNGFTAATQNTTANTAGLYKVTVTNPANGCTSTDSVTLAISNTTTGAIWLEDFAGIANGATSDNGATSWTTSYSPSTTLFSVLNNEFRISNSSTTGEGVWTSGVIDLTGKTNVSISAGIRSSITGSAVMNTTGEYADYLRFYYKLNNGTEVLFAEHLGAINNHSTINTQISVAGLNGASLQIVVRARATGSDEFYYFDNVQVSATSAVNLNATASSNGTLTCINNSVGLSGGSSVTGVSYAWSGPGGFTSTLQNPIVNNPGTYVLTVTQGACTGTASTVVAQDITPPANVTATNSGQVTCTTKSITITGTTTSTGVTYAWSGPGGFSSSSPGATVTKGGAYTFKVTSAANGCADSAITVVGENTTPPGSLSINNPGVITCITGYVTISVSATAGLNYQWTGPDGFTASTASTQVTKGGPYTLTATNPVNGCSSTQSITVAENTTPPTVTIANTSPISCKNPQVTLSATTSTPNAGFLWLGPDDFADVSPAITTSTAGTYIMTVTDPANGCTTTDVTEVTEDYSDCSARAAATNLTQAKAVTGASQQPVTAFTYNARPNPVTTNAIIQFTSPLSTPVTIRLYNAMGNFEKMLFSGQVTAGMPYQVLVNGTQLHAGAYYYIISAAGKTYTGRLIIVQ